MFTEKIKPVEVSVTLRREPFIKLEFGMGGYDSSDGDGRFFYRSFFIAMAMIVIIPATIIMMTAESLKEKLVHVLVGEIQLVPAVIATIIACFVAVFVYIRRCKCQWGDNFTMKFIFNPFSPVGKNNEPWCWDDNGYKDYSPLPNTEHRFLKKNIYDESSIFVYNGGYRLRTKFIMIDIGISIVAGLTIGFMLWIDLVAL